MTKSTICLNMIVKNESHIILSTLKNVLEHINIDYWVISDTGSTDDTIDIINKFFHERKIPGEMFCDEWKDFGHNRTKALEHAFGKSDYLFIFDADDLIEGNMNLPLILDKDCYNIQFENPVLYHRSILISNKMKWKYRGVLHESIVPIDTKNSEEYLGGDYYILSRRLGNRSKNPDKYLDDAKLLENAYNSETDLGLQARYAFYCAQSYKDCGRNDNAIKWYTKVLTLGNWNQEKYYSCLMLGNLYRDKKDYINAIKYWGESYNYDKERIECIASIMEYYYNIGQHFMVSSLYNKFKDTNFIKKYKLFIDDSKYQLFHYYASISGSYCDEGKSAYEACKYLLLNNFQHTQNTIYNINKCYIPFFKEDKENIPLIDFFINYLSKDPMKYIENVWTNIINIIKDKYPDKYDLIKKSINKKSIDKNNKYSSSNKILVYTGWMTHLWNESHLDKKALGGSEKAVAYLTHELPKNYEIIVSGDVEEGIFDNVTYIHQNKLQDLLDNTEFHTIIISRFINFLTDYNNLKCFQLILSLHDTHILNNGNNTTQILERYNTVINTVITLTNWHKSHIITLYPSLNPDKIKIINNGIDVSQFNSKNSNNKIKNKFVWSSRSERGLHIILNLWSEIIDKLPDATLDICSYGDFPINEQDNQMLKIINSYNSITYHGKLNTKELYDLMSISEYWLYTTNFTETSCITAMEMLMSEVICLYYPIAGLNDTLGDYGIPINQGEEIETLVHLSTEKKTLLREKGKEYALSCSWTNRAEEWSTILGLNKKKWAFYHNNFTIETVSQYINNQLFFCGNEYNILISDNKDEIINWQPNKLSFIFSLFDETILKSIDNTNNNFEVSLLQTEPLNLPWRLDAIINFYKIYPNIKIYDYSKSNIKILSEYNITNCEYLSYNIQSYELSKLTTFLTENVNNRIYDFGFIYNWKNLPIDEQHIINPPRRRYIVDFLRKNGFKVNIIAGYGDDRDIELSKCKIILNIHGQINNNNNPGPDECSNIFEHIRCDRLLEAGFNILSETSYELDQDFANKYPNLKQIRYDDFFNIGVINECYNNVSKQTIKKIYDTLCLNKNPFDYYLNPIDIYEHLPTLYKYASECNSVLECGVRASVSSWALVYGLISNNSNNKKMILNDIEPCDVSKLLECTKSISHLNVSYEWVSDLDLDLKENIDLTFIDSWHVGGHLKKELAKFSKLTNKYIIMHDTTVDEFTSEAIRAQLSEERIQKLAIDSSMSVDDVKMGLWTAIDDFLKNNNDWVLHERFTNNNGLTVLKKVYNKTLIEKNMDDFKCESYPYEHIIIDDFLKKDVAEKALNEMNKLSDKSACGWFNTKTKWEWNKGYWENLDNIPIQIKEIITELNSKEFINKLEKLTGIDNLIAGEILRGSSIHRINNGGYLGLHTDFNSYQMEGLGKLDRRINLLIYMNKDWKLEYSGQFDLCDLENKTCIKRINPNFNRCAIFNTSSKSIHGHPEPLNLPEGMRRQSIAIYYYTKNTNGDQDFEGHKPHCTLWHDKKDFDYTEAKIV